MDDICVSEPTRILVRQCSACKFMTSSKSEATKHVLRCPVSGEKRILAGYVTVLPSEESPHTSNSDTRKIPARSMEERSRIFEIVTAHAREFLGCQLDEIPALYVELCKGGRAPEELKNTFYDADSDVVCEIFEGTRERKLCKIRPGVYGLFRNPFHASCHFAPTMKRPDACENTSSERSLNGSTGSP
jgi:hypothetical protein